MAVSVEHEVWGNPVGRAFLFYLFRRLAEGSASACANTLAMSMS
jgi:hypothetical protein